MPPSPIRFRPPRVAVSPEVRWMLLRAFGPAGVPFPETVDPRGALAMARRFELSARIAARQGREALARELGEDAAGGFAGDRRGVTASGLRLLALAREVAGVAEGLGLPVAFLKFVALEGAGLDAAVRRSACDVDELAPAGRVGELQDALVAAGFRASGLPEGEHQLPALEHPAGGVVEVHRLMLGVRPEGSSSATFEVLERHGLLAPLPDLPGRCAMPIPEAQAAHVLVHGVGQHGWWPASYSLLKMVADLIDLTSIYKEAVLTSRALSWVESDVPPAEAEAVRRLCDRLAAGEDPASGWDGPEETLLRHILAGRLDPEYEGALRLGLFHAQPTDRPPGVGVVRRIWAALVLSRAQVDAIYGKPRHPLGYLARQLARPFDLLARLGAYGVRAARVRRGSRERRISRALETYRQGGVTFGAAAESAGISRSDLARSAHARGMKPPFSTQTLLEEVGESSHEDRTT
ncbi:MAG TPA: nucleotidyltransferase family protein [Thermoanaerobaculia bacterium]|nr:nucleotidyltransferase family protein [Thermoanaerobaculia bacterium]